MKASTTIQASATRIVKQALQVAIEATNRHELDTDQLIASAHDEVQLRRGTPRSPLFTESPLHDEDREVHKHIGILVNVIHQDITEIQRILVLCYIIEMSNQLRLAEGLSPISA